MSVGRRSGVNWIRRNEQSIERAMALASMVLPTPGTSSIRRWPSATRVTRASRISALFPWMTRSMLPRRSANRGANQVQSSGSARRSSTIPPDATGGPEVRSRPPILRSGPPLGSSTGPVSAGRNRPTDRPSTLAGLLQLQGSLEDRVEVAVLHDVHGHRRGRLAVTVLVAGEAAGDALEPGGGAQRVPELGLRDQQAAVGGLHRRCLDRIEEHVRGVEGVGVEYRGGL